MAKQYVFTFSKSSEYAIFKDGKGKEVEKTPVWKLEKMLLINLFSLACDSQKVISKSFECKDCIDALNNLSDGESIKFTKLDIEYLVDAFEVTAEKRPKWWFDNCQGILKQIDKPIADETESVDKDVD